jgi:hypothetical protein
MRHIKKDHAEPVVEDSDESDEVFESTVNDVSVNQPAPQPAPNVRDFRNSQD